MKYYLSALYDRELKEYQCPLCFSNEVMVKRYYENLLSRYMTSKEHYDRPELDYIINHIQNFVVCAIGEFDTETGKASGLEDGNIKHLFELSIFHDVAVKLNAIGDDKKVDNK